MSRKIKYYTIPKGFHYSNFIPTIKFINDKMVFERKMAFGLSCKYEVDEPSCVNKLFGFCFGFGVHQDSFRFGWTYDKEFDSYEIWNYQYNNGKLSKYVMKTVKANGVALLHYKIEVHRFVHNFGLYRYSYSVTPYIDGVPMYPIKFNSNALFVTTLGPYFGGNSRAPHKITLRELKG